MPQNELFCIFTGIEDRNVRDINKEANDFFMTASSQFDRYEIVNEYNEIEEIIIFREIQEYTAIEGNKKIPF